MSSEEKEMAKEVKIREKFVDQTPRTGIILPKEIIIATVWGVTLIIVIFEEGAIRAIMIAAVEVILGRAIIVDEVIRVKGATFVEEGIPRILIVERDDIKETAAGTGVEIGAEVTREVHTRQCQRKWRRMRRTRRLSEKRWKKSMEKSLCLKFMITQLYWW